MPEIVMTCKIIESQRRGDFEKELQDYINQFDSYSVQYKPTSESNGRVTFTALVMAPVPKEPTIH